MTMTKTKGIALLILVVLGCVAPMFAATVVYVSFNGLDTAACTRTAPCRTVTHGLTVAPAGTTVDIVGSGNYDTFTITKAVTVTAEPGVVATINVAASGTGIMVNAGSADVVALQGLNVQGSGSGTGILIKAGARITVENCVSRNFSYALDFAPTVAGTLKVKGGSFAGNNTSIFLCCAAGGAGNSVAIDGVRVYGGHFAGINADGQHITITHSLVSGDGFALDSAGNCTVGTDSVGVFPVHGTTVAENNVVSDYCFGIIVNDTAFISSSTITDNHVGVFDNFDAFTRGNNTIVNNFTNVGGPVSMMPFPEQ